jgi:hypothetical protein
MFPKGFHFIILTVVSLQLKGKFLIHCHCHWYFKLFDKTGFDNCLVYFVFDLVSFYSEFTVFDRALERNQS